MEDTPTPSLEIVTFTLGPAQTNAYLVGDPKSKAAIVIDPAWSGEKIVEAAQARDWRITHMWLTHAHFDHFGGAAAVNDRHPTAIPVAIHPDDHPMWRVNGGAALFGIQDFDPGPEPTIYLEHGMELRLGEHTFEVRQTPGHTRGHVAFLERSLGWMFCGDLIFQGSVGRTDFPEGDWDTLMQSIREEVLALPDKTRLFPGHGPETTVGRERKLNPFVVEFGR